ncbi:MAG: hypothetical protein H7293_03040 [Candidatus Saccharibacteria bacterium]|nr:hypothetical protein [Rhodoferax sp.]
MENPTTFDGYACIFCIPVTIQTTTADLQARDGDRYRWLHFWRCMVGTMASVMPSTIVNVAIPDMSRHSVLGTSRPQ